MEKLEEPLEFAFKKQQLINAEREIDWYHISYNHKMSNSICNHFPSKRFDFRDFLWNNEEVELLSSNEQSGLEQTIYEHCNNIFEDLKKNKDLEVFFDINCYRLLLNINLKGDIYYLENSTDDKERLEELPKEDVDQDAIIEYEEVLEEISNATQEIIEKYEIYGKFEKFVEEFKEEIKFFISNLILVCDEEEKIRDLMLGKREFLSMFLILFKDDERFTEAIKHIKMRMTTEKL